MKTIRKIVVVAMVWCNFMLYSLHIFHSKVVPSFTVSDDYKDCLMFTLWIVFWKVDLSYFLNASLLGIKKILRAISVVFSSFLQLFYTVGKSVSSQLHWFMKGLISAILSRWMFFNILVSYDAVQLLPHT